MPPGWVAWVAVWELTLLPMPLGIFLEKYLVAVVGAGAVARMYDVVLIYATPWTSASKRLPVALTPKSAFPTGTSAILAMAQGLNLAPRQIRVVPAVVQVLCVCSRVSSVCSKHVRPVMVQVRKSKILAPSVMVRDECAPIKPSR